MAINYYKHCFLYSSVIEDKKGILYQIKTTDPMLLNVGRDQKVLNHLQVVRIFKTGIILNQETFNMTVMRVEFQIEGVVGVHNRTIPADKFDEWFELLKEKTS